MWPLVGFLVLGLLWFFWAFISKIPAGIPWGTATEPPAQGFLSEQNE
jgi:hypothetical protein